MIPMSPALAAQVDEVERLAPSRADAAQVSRAAGEFLAAVALAHRATLIVEVGTSYGFSGLWWSAATAVTGGHLHTVDASDKKHRAAADTFAAAGVAGRVTRHLGDGRAVLAELPAGIDVAFIDADKPSTRAYFDLLWPKLKPGGGIVTDNITSHREQMADFVAHVRARTDAHSLFIPIGSGMEWTVKVR